MRTRPRYFTGNQIPRRRRPLSARLRGFDAYSLCVIGMLLLGLLVSGVTLAHFKHQCSDQGGTISILWSGKGGFKCNGPDGQLLDVY